MIYRAPPRAEAASPPAPATETARPGRSGLWPLVAFVIACLCTAGPILMHLHLPLIDLPNHIARHVIMATTGGALLEYYSATTALVPNSAVDLLWRLTGYPVGAERFSQLVLAGYAVLLIAAVMVLSRTLHGRWMVWPAVAGLVVFNASFFWGFQNFIVAVPFSILAMALWLWLEDRPLGLRVAILGPVAALLYIMHFFAFAAFAIMAFGREMQLLQEASQPRRQLGRGLIMALPFLGPLAWLLHDVLTGGESPAGHETGFGPLMSKLRFLNATFEVPLSQGSFLLNLSGLLGFVALVLCLMTLRRRAGGPRLRLAPTMKGPIIAVAIAALVSPTWLNGVALVHIRLPLVLMLLFLAATRWEGVSKAQARGLAVVFLALLVARGALVERYAARHDAEINDLLAVLQAVPPGARVLPLRARGHQRDLRLSHVQGYAVSTRSAFVPTLFLGVHAITLAPRWKDYAHPALFALDECFTLPDTCYPAEIAPTFVQDWQQKFTHILLLDAAPSYLQKLPELTPLATVGRFTVYRTAAGLG